ncbi:MAG: hypothetical protein HQ536_03990 [Parcubacteria group bacterium]|nr:hypothetical protein [Parcubacteria group bacterium]
MAKQKEAVLTKQDQIKALDEQTRSDEAEPKERCLSDDELIDVLESLL